MKKNVSGRELVLVIFLVLIVGAVLYYMMFYKPLQAELSNIQSQSVDIDNQILNYQSKITEMDAMQAELDMLFAKNEKLTEIAPYDNKEVVFNQLSGILARSEQYNLNFAKPSINKTGTVRRNVTMSFSCPDYESAKSILQDLNECQWRCLISNLSITGAGNIMEGPVNVSATITFFESTNL